MTTRPRHEHPALAELQPLAAVVTRTLHETPVRLGAGGEAELVAALTLAAAAYMGRQLGPNPAALGTLAGALASQPTVPAPPGARWTELLGALEEEPAPPKSAEEQAAELTEMRTTARVGLHEAAHAEAERWRARAETAEALLREVLATEMRSFRLHTPDGDTYDGVAFPSGRVVIDHPERGLVGAYLSMDVLRAEQPAARIEWADGSDEESGTS